MPIASAPVLPAWTRENGVLMPTVEASYVCAFVYEEGLWLPILSLREDRDIWEFQGGGPDPEDKTTLDTAFREFKEETKIKGKFTELLLFRHCWYIDVPERLDYDGRLRPPASYQLFCCIALPKAMEQIEDYRYEKGDEVRSFEILKGPWPKMSITQGKYFVPRVIDSMANFNCH